MIKNLAVVLSTAFVVMSVAPAAFATPVALGGSDTRGTSASGHMGGGMHHHTMMKHHMKMKMTKHSAM